MLKKILVLVIVATFLTSCGIAFAAIPTSDYLISIAMNFYKQGYYDEALQEFNKVLLVEPGNAQALSYIEDIKKKYVVSRQSMIAGALDDFEQGQSSKSGYPTKDAIVNREMDQRAVSKQAHKKPTVIQEKIFEKKKPKTGDYVDVSGEYQVAGGVRNGTEGIWKEANGDLNEKNYRILFGTDKHNTYDPAIYDRVRVNLDTKNLSELGLDNVNVHANITVDPWSFTGKTDTFTLTGIGGDSAEFELKYWSNTGKTINEIVNTLNNGDALALPEIKVINGVTTATSAMTTFGNTFNIPSKKINRDFVPLREFWFDYKDDLYSLRFFPIAYQDQALTTDDPLVLSNRHTWWEESPWLADWKPGNLNTGALPNDFAKGIWDDSLAFFTRDSDGLRLTALRGFAFAYNGIDLDFQSTLASPKNLWADYTDFKTYDWANRLKYDLSYNAGLGLTYTGHFGYKSDVLDGFNNVFGFDAKHEPFVGTKLSAEVAASDSTFDRSSKEFVSRKRGNAYMVSMVNRFPADEIYEQDYDAIKKTGSEVSFLKSRFRLARMDSGFQSTLSSYRQTRDDEFWSRHISFRKHPLYVYSGLTKPMSFDDIRPFAIGDGIDNGRSVISLRLEGETELFGRNLEGLFDVRNVHAANSGAFIENVSRLELEYPMTDNLIARFLGIRQNMHKTYANQDPFIFDVSTGKPLVNTAIVAGEDPSLGTISLGADYKVNEKISFNAVYEHTNDSTVAEDNYPRGLFNSASFTTVTENGKIYREPIPFLYSQQYFDLPPYDYFDITKAGFSFRPVDKLEFYLDFAYNLNKMAGQIDDNMNHYGLEIAYTPTNKLSFIFKYTYSRWIDMLLLNATGREVYSWHNNFFIQSRYDLAKDSEFILEYGVGGVSPIGSVSYDPFGGSLAVLDTRHIVRAYYRKTF